jgi:hypothetical protein
MKLPKNLANILLAVFLILYGLSAFKVNFPFMEIIIGVCAIAAGILLLIRK